MTTEPKKKLQRTISIRTRTNEFYFLTGLINVIFSSWLVGAFPCYYWLYHCIKNFFLMVRQIFRRKSEGEGKHYYQFEFCYIVNYLTCFYFVVCVAKRYISTFHFIRPYTDRFGYIVFRVIFAWVNGPLALSVIQQKNGFVFHSLDHMTILAVHIGPPVVSYTMRWYSDALDRSFPDTFHIDTRRSETTMELLTNLFYIPVISYLCLWTLPYLFTMYLLRSHTKQKGYISMVETLERDRDGSPTAAMKILHVFGPKFNTLVYCIVHATLCTLSFLIAQILWRSFLVHTFYLVSLLLVAAWNSATFYFEKLVVYPEERSESSAEDNKMAIDKQPKTAE